MKQFLKKSLAVFLAILLALPTMCFGTFAEPTVPTGKAVASKNEIYKNEPVTISLELEGNTAKVGSAQMALFYNSSAFAYVDESVDSDYFVPETITVNNQPAKSVVKMSVSNGKKTLAAGTVVSYTFQPTSSAVEGEEYEFSFGNKDNAILYVTASASTGEMVTDGNILSSGTTQDGFKAFTVKVKIIEKTYTVTYTDGVSGEAIFEDQVFTVGEGKPTPAFSGGIPQRAGYAFEGWTPAVAATVTSNAVYQAAWTKTWQITYTDGVEGEELFPDQVYTVKDGEPVPIFSGAIPTRPGYSFLGWIIPSPNANADMNIVPMWSRNPVYYSVTYTDGVDGEEIFPDQTVSVLEGSATPAFSSGIPSSAVPVREGYVFAGWTPAVAAVVTSDAIYAATWKKLYTVTYTDGVDDEEIFPDQTYEVPEGDPVPAFQGEVPARYGYEFRGWNVPSGGIAADATVTPIWYKLPTFTVTYTDGTGSSAVFADQVYTDIVISSATPAFSSGIPSSAIPVRAGYVFDGWTPAIADIVTSNAVYTAKWKMEITVVYNDGVPGEELFPDQVYHILEGDEIPAFVGTISRPGYVFLGWNIPSGAVSPTMNITPNWQKLPTYTVTYKDGVGGTVFADQSYTVVVGSTTPAFRPRQFRSERATSLTDGPLPWLPR